MTPEDATIETLRRWSQVLLWASVVLPVLGALAGGVRFYVERQEKQLSARITTEAINRATKEAATTRSHLANLEQKTAPRSLSPEQQKSLLGDLRAALEGGIATKHILINKLVVTAANGNQEAQSFAMQFVKIFKAAGFESELNLPIPGLRPDVIGIHIGIKGSQNIPESALALAKILANAGIQSTISQMEPHFSSSFPEAQFVLAVGAKS